MKISVQGNEACETGKPEILQFEVACQHALPSAPGQPLLPCGSWPSASTLQPLANQLNSQVNSWHSPPQNLKEGNRVVNV